jgi:MtrB/PioB family decaheme-associated outer membrane protein
MIRNSLQSCASILVGVFFLYSAAALADDQVSGSLDVGAAAFLGNEPDSAKFEEYRDVPDGVLGDAKIKYRGDNGYHAGLDAKQILKEDQQTTLDGGKYGAFSLELDYNQIPHDYANEAVSWYSGVGSDRLRMSNDLQNRLQNSASLVDVADALNSAPTFLTNVDSDRKRSRATLKVDQYDPFNLLLEIKRDEQDGTRPIGAGFGFSNAVEILEPRDFRTTEYRLNTEYASKKLYASIGYYGSMFENKTDTLRWDNPFTTQDSNFNPATGQMDLAPDNSAHNVFLNGAIRQLPLDSQLTLQGAWGWLRQDDDLEPYTVNTAINPLSSPGVPFEAANRSSLPVLSADRSVNPSLYNTVLTSSPLSFMDAKAKYRYYRWDNDSSQISFPGFVGFDSSWQPEQITTDPLSYTKQTTGLDIDFDVYRANKLGLGYTFEHMDREHREVNKTNDNTIKASWNNKRLEWMTVRAGYEHAQRRIDGNYDPVAPYDGIQPISQLPFLRKYDEANRDRDKVELLTTISPLDAVEVTGSISYGKSDYSDSPFGLQDDTFGVYSLDADYTVDERTKIYAFYSFERHESNQLNRGWSLGGPGDPYGRGVQSSSNWSAELTDNVHTVGGGLEYALLPEKLLLKVTYTLSAANGKASFASPVGTSANDANPFVPEAFDDVDDTIINTLNPQLIVLLQKNLTFAVGYLWEKYDVGDYNKKGFANVPQTSNGSYNGALLMGTLPIVDYEVNWVYAKFTWSF